MTARIASLGMYDRAEIQAANDALWSALAARLEAAGIARVPARLDRDRSLAEIWDDPDLLLAQTCGYPLTTRWRGRLRYVATPRYRAIGCEGAFHRSRIVVRRDEPAETLADMRGRRAAINARDSNTGMNLFRAAIARHAGGRPFFQSVHVTGAHDASARLVAEGGADVAAIDSVTFALLERHDPDLAGRLRTLAWSEPAPGLPLVTALGTGRQEIATLRHALDAVAQDAALADTRDTLLIEGFEILNPARYRSLLAHERRAERRGYPDLA